MPWRETFGIASSCRRASTAEPDDDFHRAEAGRSERLWLPANEGCTTGFGVIELPSFPSLPEPDSRDSGRRGRISPAFVFPENPPRRRNEPMPLASCEKDRK